ncbi:MAG: DUF4093 domain-containing protein [Clostridia bacterium]|nr:DUF4093 domain-containing protein [Clostridia bacterium]
MVTTQRAVIVEGKYDKIRLAAVVDALIVTTEGFGIFSDKEKQRFLKKLAAEKGLLILTDSDAAGFKIRNYLKNIVPEEQIVHAYIPDIYGKERRKDAPSREGKLGVEGMDTVALEEALQRCGAFEEGGNAVPRREITTADLFDAGLTGKPDSAEKRRTLLRQLGLPARLTGKSFLQALNVFMTREEFDKLFPVDRNEE